MSDVRGVIHRQTNRQHKEHGGDDVDCQTPEMYGPHDVNLLMDDKLTEATLKVHFYWGLNANVIYIKRALSRILTDFWTAKIYICVEGNQKVIVHFYWQLQY